MTHLLPWRAVPSPARSIRRILPVLVLLCTLQHPAAAQHKPGAPDPSGEAAENAFFFRIEDVRRYFAWGWDLLPTGLDLTVGYRLDPWFDGVSTFIQATVGGGYEGFGTFRDTDYTPNTPSPDVADSEGTLEFNSPNIQWEAGLRQGILWNPGEQRNLLEALLFYRGRYDRYLKGRHYWGDSDAEIAAIKANHEAWQAAYAGTDAYGIFGSSLITGLTYDALRFDGRTKAYDGTFAEVSFEFSPYFASVMGASDFWRINFSTKTFRILYEARSGLNTNRLTVYAGSYFSIDYADARRQMPLYVMQSFGGTDLREGLADSVRGFEKYSWDTQLKIVHNLELRCNLPLLYSFLGRDLLPGVVAYFDLGYGALYWQDPADTPGGFLGSTGVGVFLDMLDFTYLHAYAHFPVIGDRIDGAPIVLDLAIRAHF